MEEAIRVSNNVYHAKLAGLLGPQRLVETAREAGLSSGTLPEQCSVALGSGSAYPLAMASAYATFANNGSRCEPLAVTRIELGELAGGGKAEYKASCEEVLDPDVASRMNALLQEPVEGGTATAAQLDRPVAGKTGTTDDYKDAWFVGYVPQLSTSAWVGYEQPKAMEDVLGVEQVTGGTIPAQLWVTYMREAVDGMDVQDFDDPPRIEPVDVPKFKGEMATDLVEEYEEDFTFNLETRRVRNFRPAGTVVRQRPKAGREVDPGKLVTLFVSDGRGKPPRVPDVVGMRPGSARTVLTDAEYRVEVQREREVVRGPLPDDANTVVAMSPGAGTRLEPGKVVTITVREYDQRKRRNDNDDDNDNDGDSNNDNDNDNNNGNGGGNGGGNGDDEPGPDEPPEPGDRPGRPRPDPSPDPLPEPTDAPAPSSSRQVKFARIVADPPGDDLRRNGGEYVTIAAGRSPVDVSNWSIEYEGGGVLRIGDGYRMASGATLDIHTGTGDNDPPERFFNGLRREVLRDDGGVLILRDDKGREVTRREY
jgi:membrane peptidoglycan carboxypeptidase